MLGFCSFKNAFVFKSFPKIIFGMALLLKMGKINAALNATERH